MNASTNSVKSGKHTVSFIFVVPIVLVVLYLLSLIFHPANIGTQLVYVLWVLFRVVVGAVLFFILDFAFNTLILNQTPGKIVAGLRRFEHATGIENLSRAFLTGGMLFMAAQIAGWPLGSTMSQYMYEVMSKGPIALLVAILVTMFGAFFLGIKSIDHFAQYVEDPRNNQIVLVLMILVNAVVFLAMR
jgi:hypothetical protein